MRNTRLKSFQLLGVAPDATLHEIKRAYRKIAKRLHPDRTGGDVQAFRRITAAYNTLLEAHKEGQPRRHKSSPFTAQRPSAKPQKKSAEGSKTASDDSKTVPFSEFKFEWSKQYAAAQQKRRAQRYKRKNTPSSDKASVEQPKVGQREEWKEWRAKVEASVTPKTVQTKKPEATHEEIDEENRTSASQLIVNWFKQKKRHFQSPQPNVKGEDVKLRLKTTEQTLLFGGHHRIALQRLVACPSCQGINARSCSICRHAGRVKVREEVTVYVPPGALSGTQVRVPGKGTAGLSSHADGDLILIIETDLPRGFRLDGLDLLGTYRIDRNLAENGGVVELNVPRGKVRVRVPRNTKNGDRLRLREQGVPSSTSNLIGDVYLDLSVGRIG